MTLVLGLLNNGLLILGSWWLARDKLRLVDRLDRVLAAAVLALSWCVLGLELLGSVGQLASLPLLGWTAILFVFALGVRTSRPRPQSVGDSDLGERSPWEASSIVAAALVLWPAVVLGMQSLLMAVKVVSDGPIYHLYFAIRWWKEGSLIFVPAPFGENAATYFPANGDLWFTWLITTFGSDHPARVGQVPFLGLAGLSAFGIATRLGAGRNSAMIASCWFVSLVPLLLFTFEPNVDTIFVANYLAAVYFLLRSLTGLSGPSGPLLAGLAAGLALGTKPVGLVFVAPLLLLALIGLWLSSGPRREVLKASALLTLGTILTSAFWYLRNTLITGNPLYPLHVTLLGFTVFPGCYDATAMRASIYYMPVTAWRALVDTLLAVVDPRFLLFWFPAILGGWAWGSRSRGVRDRWVWAMAGLALLNIALYWIFVPYRTQQRFMLHAFGLAATPLARMFDRSRALRISATILLALHVLTAETWPFAAREQDIPWDLESFIPNVVPPPLPVVRLIEKIIEGKEVMPAVNGLLIYLAMGACAVMTVWSLSREGRPFHRKSVRGAILVVATSGLVGLATLASGVVGADPRQHHYPSYPDFLAGWLQLEARSGTGGTRVAYAGTNIPYYLFGTHLRNDVRYVNVDHHVNWLLHDYQRAAQAQGKPLWPNSRPGWDRIQPSYQDWLENLRSNRISLLVVTVVNSGEGSHNVADAEKFPIERRWADSHPDDFEILYGAAERDRFFRLYRLRPESRSRG